MQSTAFVSNATRVDVVCAADDAYAIPLAVMLRSVCDHLDPAYTLRVFLLDGGISESSWVGLKETMAGTPAEICVISPDRSDLSDLRISHHISHTAYFRLLAAELLPADVDRAIYLDSDLFVREDLTYLWHLPLEGQYCLATIDIACPYIDARLGARNYRLSNPYLAALRPIRNYRELGLDGRAEYFNSGVMLLNLARWRREGVAEHLLRCLRDNERHVWCWDQYALNAVFAGQWGRFGPRWNQGAHTFEYPTEHHSPIDPKQWVEMKNDPAIIHFTTEFKPWHVHNHHPRSEVFYRGLQATAWRHWTPAAPEFSWKCWLDRHLVRLFKRATISSRKIASIWA